MKITGRKKEIIITSGGKNIAPAYIESLLKGDPLFGQVVVIGDARNFLTALIVPEHTALQFAAGKLDMPWNGVAEAIKEERIRKLFADKIQQRLVKVSRYEQIGNFTLLEKPFSAEAGELTLTLKLRRSVIAERYKDVIEAMYAVSHEPAV